MKENRKLLVEQTELQASQEGAKKFCEEASKNIYVLKAKQQQVGLGIRVWLPSCLTINMDKAMQLFPD